MCPLCNDQSFTSSWLGTTRYDEKNFEYVECQSCKSLYCNPMPDSETLAKMYKLDYFGLEAEEQPVKAECFDPPDRFVKPLTWLKSHEPAVLLDYGCGTGDLLESAGKSGWQITGVDFDPEVTKRVSQKLGAKVVTDVHELGEGFQADVLHLGDVFEHLTEVNQQVPEILKLLKPNGVLLAQGPLEANANLFTFILKQSRKINKNKISEMPPYHVMLATAQGQRDFFKRFGLKEIKFEITEVSHPAPEKIGLSDISNPQKLGMFTVRQLSKMTTRLNSKKWGNRYFYVGQFSGN